LEEGVSKVLMERIKSSQITLCRNIFVRDILPNGQLYDQFVVVQEEMFGIPGDTLYKRISSLPINEQDSLKYADHSSQFSLSKEEVNLAMFGSCKIPKKFPPEVFGMHLGAGKQPITVILNSLQSQYMGEDAEWKKAIANHQIRVVNDSPFASLGDCYSHWHMDSLRTPSLATLVDSGLGQKVGKIWLLMKGNIKKGREWSKTPDLVDGLRKWMLTKEMVQHKDVQVCFLPVGHTLYFPASVHHCVLTVYCPSVIKEQKITGVAGVNFCAPENKEQAKQALFSLSLDKIDTARDNVVQYYMQICFYWKLTFPSKEIQEDPKKFQQYLHEILDVKPKKSKKQKQQDNILKNKAKN
jgi:hypothetical protein